jgi:hypothetical protein
MKFTMAAVLLAHLMAFLMVGETSQAQGRSIQEKVVRGESLDATNFSCSDEQKLSRQRVQAKERYEERWNMVNGICAWHSGDFFSEDPHESIQSLGEDGCRLAIEAKGVCNTY